MQIKDLAQLAEQAMIDEVMVNPKPGLVDPVTNGSHPDMDVFTFAASAVSLRSYFNEITILGANFEGTALTELFQQIRLLGIEAEKTMFKATNGVNTHKGAIFSLGVMSTAASFVLTHRNNLELEVISETIKEMLTGLTQRDFAKVKAKSPQELTAGEREYLKYGLTGIRGEAEAGFPIVFNEALPFLKDQKNNNRNDRLIDTLMKIVSITRDSNLIKRAGDQKIVGWAKAQANEYFSLGASQTKEGRSFLKELDQTFTDRNLSLGGSADLLILTIYLALVFDWL
ncbi:triphosphoribosyl-dephospho-CoA synthase CitG [Xylocopilactobacillus apis]|uniref:Probable 2-(5''-triphosphoribosyl)-3'-dephosphocoenzyme-A synthase n=1 Tax=Xylocopilactobacillus apis TaxID=2932183 RepID=A0AAU9DM29_9LACO|nr:triphosphoribosyl-dephospho-CoA synthase CitG [Xylocopilactobacillus apis]BDR55913.1 putative 2-(5''-triphosphoribosyl)-3'-dephosphocoenzyme-A synthase [Xylocopilactobacillus apis]